MTGKETLINVLESAESAIYWNSSDKGFIEKVADHLIANDVVPVVRCKDCKYQNEDGDCDIHDEWFTRKPESFCCYGERKDNVL